MSDDNHTPAGVTDEGHRDALLGRLISMGYPYTSALLMVETTSTAIDAAVSAFEAVVDKATYLDIGMQADLLGAQLAASEFMHRAAVAQTTAEEHMPSRKIEVLTIWPEKAVRRSLSFISPRKG